jgi:hypothetical protein
MRSGRLAGWLFHHRLPSPEARAVLKGPRVRAPLLVSILGMTIGCFLILFTIQVVHGFSRLLHREFDATVGESLVISHKASLVGMVTRSAPGFTAEEIGELRRQPFVRDIGPINMSRFRARLTGTESIPFTTELFFESVPDRFLDTVPDGWDWHEGDPTVPLIVSREFLALYNFGFAVAYRLPQLTPHTLQSLRLSLELNGPMGIERFTGRIAGFSDRYTSLLVPETFLAWANSRFGTGGEGGPSRLVLRVANPENRQLATFLERNGYEANREKTKNSRLWNLLVALAGIAGAGGSVITILALLVAGLSFQLSMTRCDREIVLLTHLGVAPSSLVNYFVLRSALLIVGSTLCGMAAALFAAARFAGLVGRFGFKIPAGSSILLPLSAGLVIVAGVACHAVMVNRHVRKLLVSG